MYLAYLDASGSALLKEKENYVLSAIITNECSWQIIDNSIKQIKIKHFPQIADEDVEFHAKDMLNRDDILKTCRGPLFIVFLKTYLN